VPALQIQQYTNQSDQPLLVNLPLRQVSVRARLLNIFGQRLRDVRLQVIPRQNQWSIDVQGGGVSGRILAPAKMNRSGLIIIDFDRLNLARTNTNGKTNFDLQSMPSIDFNANNVIYNDISLGRVKFKSSSNNGMKINLLTITSPRIKLQATGDWMPSNNSTITRLKGSATSNNVSAMLSGFGFDVRNFIATNGKFNFNLSWRSSPFSPDLATMNGDAQLEIDQGRIIDVGQTSGAKMDIGKMLSIFSLQSIPRRLTFDFSDVFQKGYSFDSLKGDFTLKNGDAQTTNTRFDGSIATVTIHGRIGLLKKDYDFVLSVTPYITSSVPVAATLLTLNPLVGVAAFAVNKVVGKAVSQVTTYYYSVTGSWDNPIYKPI